MFHIDDRNSTFESRRLASEKAIQFDLRVAELLAETENEDGDPKEQVLAAVHKAQQEIFGGPEEGELVYEYD